MPTNAKDAARQYFDLGYPVAPFAIEEGGERKQPLIKAGDKDRWLSEGQSLADFNSLPWDGARWFGILHGRALKNGLFPETIDYDRPDDGWKKAEPTTSLTGTVRGRVHLDFLSRRLDRNQDSSVGVQLRARGLWTVVAPSEGYRLLNDNPKTVVETVEPIYSKLVFDLGGTAKREVVNVKELLKGVPVGQRDMSAIKLATFYRKQGLDKAETYGKLCVWNKRNQEPLGNDAIMQKVESAFSTLEPYKYLFQEEPNSRNRECRKDSGTITDGYFEAIYRDGKPCFLVRDRDGYRLTDSLQGDGETLLPKEQKHIPYIPYGYYQGDAQGKDELYKEVRQIFEDYVDVESCWKDVLAACVLLSYQQEKVQSVPYVFLYGDNESGKSTVLQLLKILCYRPMYGVTVPPADIFGFLEDSDSIGCVLEDEVQGIDKDTDKIKIYKAGYKQGAVVPRTLITANDRIIKYYNTFCFKACASEQIPQVKGFRERFLEIPMVEGYPVKEWSDITREDQERMQTLRNRLLRWRMETRDATLPIVQLDMKGRLKELWKPLLQATHGLKVYETLLKFVTEQKAQRLNARQESLEGHIVKTVVDIFNEDKSAELEDYIPFKTIWDELVLDLDGKLSDDKPHVMDTSEFFQVTKNKVGYRLREVLGGKSKTVRKDQGDDERTFKAYEFNRLKLDRVARKYGYKLVTKLSSYPSSEGVQPPETMEKDHQNNGVEAAYTPEEVGNFSNLVTASKTPFQPHPVEEV